MKFMKVSMSDIEVEEDIISALERLAESVLVDYIPDQYRRHAVQKIRDKFQWYFGGQMQYIPKPDSRIVDLSGRNMAIWEEFNQGKRKGLSNINHLARKYGLSTNQIYTIINSFRAPEH